MVRYVREYLKQCGMHAKRNVVQLFTYGFLQNGIPLHGRPTETERELFFDAYCTYIAHRAGSLWMPPVKVIMGFSQCD